MGEWYRTGTVSVTNGSANVVGVGTLWLTQASVGDIFLGPDLVEYEITSITDDTHLALKQINGTAAYAGTTNSAQVYAIIRNFTSTLPAQLASQLAALMTTYHVTLDELTAWLSGTGTVTVHDAVGNAYSVQTPAAMNAVLTGRLVKSVAGGVDVTLTTAEAANLFIELTGTLTANINLIMPAGVRHNFILNNTSGAYTVTVKTAAGTGVAVTQGKRGLLECDGTNVVNAQSQLDGAAINGGTIDGAVIGGTTKAAGSFTTIDGTSRITATGTAPRFELVDSTATVGVSFQLSNGGGHWSYGEVGIYDASNAQKAYSYSSVSDYHKHYINGVAVTTISAGSFAVAGVISNRSGDGLTLSDDTVGGFMAYGYSGSRSNAAAHKFYDGRTTLLATVGTTGTVTSKGFATDNSAATEFTQELLNLASGGAGMVQAYNGAGGGWNAAGSALLVTKNTATGRSINASGTINASGADYAEYEHNNGLAIVKGDVVGFKPDGTLTDLFADAVRFGIKSTNPSYVGGDVWGTEAEVGARPFEPVFAVPDYVGSAAPDAIPNQPDAPALSLPASPVQQPGETVETFAMRTAAWQQQCAEVQAAHDAALAQCPAALAAWQSLKDAYDLSLAQHQSDMAAHDDAVAAAQHEFDTVTYPAYQADLAAFEVRLEAARQFVDRIAYSGKVPVNVTGATPGEYLVAVAAADGGITAIPVADPTFAQYKLAVGRVNRILPDGRAEVAVIVH